MSPAQGSPAPPGCAGTGPGTGCRSHAPGHLAHALHAHLLGRTPWGWRAGRVTSLGADGWLTVGCTEEVGSFRAWHHRDLTGALAVDEPVRVHERHGALAAALGVLSLHIERGVGAIPEPVALERWAGAALAGVVDLRTRAPLSEGAVHR